MKALHKVTNKVHPVLIEGACITRLRMNTLIAIEDDFYYLVKTHVPKGEKYLSKKGKVVKVCKWVGEGVSNKKYWRLYKLDRDIVELIPENTPKHDDGVDSMAMVIGHKSDVLRNKYAIPEQKTWPTVADIISEYQQHIKELIEKGDPSPLHTYIKDKEETTMDKLAPATASTAYRNEIQIYGYYVSTISQQQAAQFLEQVKAEQKANDESAAANTKYGKDIADQLNKAEQALVLILNK